MKQFVVLGQRKRGLDIERPNLSCVGPFDVIRRNAQGRMVRYQQRRERKKRHDLRADSSNHGDRLRRVWSAIETAG